MVTEAIILAGGLGTRLREVVLDRPKPMALVENKPFLEHLMNYWIEQGIDHCVLSVGYKHEMIQEYFGTHYGNCQISYVIEEKPLGTGGGLLLGLKALRFPANPCLILNGDTYFKVNLRTLLDFHTEKSSSLSLSLYKVKNNHRYSSVLLDKQARVQSFVNHQNGDECLINGGVYLVNPFLFDRYSNHNPQTISLEVDLLPHLLKESNKIYGYPCNTEFLDIGIPADYFRAAELINS